MVFGVRQLASLARIPRIHQSLMYIAIAIKTATRAQIRIAIASDLDRGSYIGTEIHAASNAVDKYSGNYSYSYTAWFHAGI